jgi:DNA-binding NarL/FixJ family response regulator
MFPSNSTSMKVERARILIADATTMGAQLLADALRRAGRFAGVSVATCTTDVMALLANQPFDVLLIQQQLRRPCGGP